MCPALVDGRIIECGVDIGTLLNLGSMYYKENLQGWVSCNY